MGGIYKKKCSGKASALDHCVQLVGYNKAQNYWKVRNSWASDWGEDGFIRLPMGENACGIADEVTYVTATMNGPAPTPTPPAPTPTPTPTPTPSPSPTPVEGECVFQDDEDSCNG